MAIHPVLLVMGLAVIVSPLLLAVRIELQARRFQTQAFGHLSRAARNLRQAVWGVLAFYVLVVGGGAATGQYATLFEWPLGGDAALVYLRILAVTVAYALFGRVAQQLYLVTVPGGDRVNLRREDIP